MARYGMVINLKRCVGCYACVIACKAEHGTPANVFWNKVDVHEIGTYPNARMTFRPVLCNHCSNPPCETVCPTGATFKKDNGIVGVDADMCIGCGYCVVACPYKQRTFTPKKAGYFPEKEETAYEKENKEKHTAGTVTKCVFCEERVAKGLKPACSTACPGGARIFGDLDDPNSEISKLLGSNKHYRLLPELNTEAAVYYIPD